MRRLCEFYPGICLTTEEKAQKNLSQGKKNLSQVKKNLSQSTVYSIYLLIYKLLFTSLFELISKVISVLKFIQKDATLHSLFYLETALHVSGGGTTRNM